MFGDRCADFELRLSHRPMVGRNPTKSISENPPCSGRFSTAC
jgi:hypothetical protein